MVFERGFSWPVQWFSLGDTDKEKLGEDADYMKVHQALWQELLAYPQLEA